MPIADVEPGNTGSPQGGAIFYAYCSLPPIAPGLCNRGIQKAITGFNRGRQYKTEYLFCSFN
jgi:hypothetical protein